MVSHYPFVFPFQKNTLENFKCGGDFLPSPLASKPRFALSGDAVLTKSSLLTAVAVAVENDHTIAFLGNSQGEVFKVSFHLPDPSSLNLLLVESSMGGTYFLFSVQVHLADEQYVYGKTPGDTMGERVNRNLFFDLNQNHLYITTEKKVYLSGSLL